MCIRDSGKPDLKFTENKKKTEEQFRLVKITLNITKLQSLYTEQKNQCVINSEVKYINPLFAFLFTVSLHSPI